jgi:uncharacterized protein (TIGR02266 family)
MEKRQGQRIGFRVWADNNSEQEISLWLGEDFEARDDFKFCYSSKDVSESGMFLETTTPLNIDDVLNLEFSMPGTEKSISVNAKVARVRTEGDFNDGMGVLFIDLSEEDKIFIKEFVEKYSGNNIN